MAVPAAINDVAVRGGCDDQDAGMSPRYIGRHTGRAPMPDTSGNTPYDTEPKPNRTPTSRSRVRRLPGKKVLLWLFMSACTAFILYAAWGLIQLIDDLNHPSNGDWLCSADSSTCEP
jgi:hypothetical protein